MTEHLISSIYYYSQKIDLLLILYFYNMDDFVVNDKKKDNLFMAIITTLYDQILKSDILKIVDLIFKISFFFITLVFCSICNLFFILNKFYFLAKVVCISL